MESRPLLKPLFWMGSSRKDLKGFPEEVQDEMGYALRDAQFGGTREGVVYVLHAFQKKSKRGITTPQTDRDLIRARLKAAERHYLKWRVQDDEEAR